MPFLLAKLFYTPYKDINNLLFKVFICQIFKGLAGYGKDLFRCPLSEVLEESNLLFLDSLMPS